MGFVDDGPPFFVITNKARFDTTGEVSNDEPVRSGVALPKGFTLDTADPNHTSYRYNGPPADGTTALNKKGFIQNLSIAQSIKGKLSKEMIKQIKKVSTYLAVAVLIVGGAYTVNAQILSNVVNNLVASQSILDAFDHVRSGTELEFDFEDNICS